MSTFTGGAQGAEHEDSEGEDTPRNRKPYVATEDGVVLADPNAEISFAVTKNLRARKQAWMNTSTTWGEFTGMIAAQDNWPVEADKFDALAQTAGPTVGSERTTKAMMGLDLLFSDHDDGQSMDESAELARAAGYETAIFPSFNCGSTAVEIVRDDFVAWARKHSKSPDLTEQTAREYLYQTKLLLKRFAEAAPMTEALLNNVAMELLSTN